MFKSSETHLVMPFLGKRKKQYLTSVLIWLEQIRVINILNNPVTFRIVLIIKNQKTISAPTFSTFYTLSKNNFMGTVIVQTNARVRNAVTGC